MRRFDLHRTFWIAAVLVLAQGCASTTPARHAAVPPELTAQAEIPGMPGVRYIGGGDFTELSRVAADALRREQELFVKQGGKGSLPPVAFLAVSGGGDNGAYTAGLLNGWTAQGSRPEFKLVTGISTGALIAPFAFLGPKYDATLKEVYTTITPPDVLVPRGLIAGFMSDAMADNAPLWTLTRKSVTADLLKEIAAEYAKGRFLLVATADLDARRGLIWDMGKIASYGTPQALDLFVSVMIASASILAALRALVGSGAAGELQGELVAAFVPSEEDGGQGMLAAIRAGITGDMAVITEPTDLEIVVAHAGALTFRLTVPGRAAHASMRREGVSALDRAHGPRSGARGRRDGQERGRDRSAHDRARAAVPDDRRDGERRRLGVDGDGSSRRGRAIRGRARRILARRAGEAARRDRGGRCR